MGPIVTIYDRWQYMGCAKLVIPLINERLGQLNDERLPVVDQKAPVSCFLFERLLLHADGWQSGPAADYGRQNDYFQWAIMHGLAHWDPLELSASVLARRLACLCFAAIQSSVITMTNTLFDLASSPECGAWLDAMRTEVLREVSGAAPWSKAGLARMTRVDSALRESMRLNGFVARGIMKMVIPAEGVTLPGGSHVPRGTKVGLQAYNVHRDADIYADADRYDAFRFVPAATTAAAVEGDGGPPAKATPQALVTTSPTFLAFSHGPNAWCVLPALSVLDRPPPGERIVAPALTKDTQQSRALLCGQPAQADAGAHRHALRHRAHCTTARHQVVRG